MTRAVPFQLTDSQWAKIRLYVALPDPARDQLDNLGSFYLTYQDDNEDRQSNSSVREELKQISRAASKLGKLMRRMSIDARLALTDSTRAGASPGPKPRLDAWQRLEDKTRAVRLSSINFHRAAKSIPNQKRGFDPSNLRWLVEGAVYVSEQHLGTPFVEQIGRRKYISLFAKAVDSTLGEGKIDNAIDAWGTPPK